MINPEAIDLSLLPWVPLEKRSQLPSMPGVYLAIDGDGVVQYVGQALKSLKTRWAAHHRYYQMAKTADSRIAYLTVEDCGDLDPIEQKLIAQFKPPMNGNPRKRKTLPHAQAGIRVIQKKVVFVEVEDLPTKIRTARRCDPRPLMQIASEAKMTPAYWYSIENGKMQIVPEVALRRIEKALNTDFGVKFD